MRRQAGTMLNSFQLAFNPKRIPLLAVVVFMTALN